jgi:hypothetical protein
MVIIEYGLSRTGRFCIAHSKDIKYRGYHWQLSIFYIPMKLHLITVSPSISLDLIRALFLIYFEKTIFPVAISMCPAVLLLSAKSTSASMISSSSFSRSTTTGA